VRQLRRCLRVPAQLTQTSAGLAVYRTRLDALAALRPDVVLTQVQCASGALSLADAERALQALCGGGGEGRRVTLLHLDAESLDTAWAEVAAVGAALGCGAKGEALAGWCRARVDAVSAAARGRGPPRACAVVQWTQPLFLAGGWVPELLRAAGGRDACDVPPGGASLALQPRQLADAAPEVLLLALCGLGVEDAAKEARALARSLGPERWAQLPAVRRGAVVAADAAELLLEVLWPEAQPHGHQGRSWRRVAVDDAAFAEDQGGQATPEAAPASSAGARSAAADRERERELAYV